MPLQIADPIAGTARDHEDRVEFALARQHVGKGEQAVAANQINLVQSKDRFTAPLGEAIKNSARVAVDAAGGIDQKYRLVSILSARPGCRHHRPVETAPRGKDPRGVDVDDLRRTFDRNAE